ncbi:class I SAM-dependent DNA methyltransferase [Brevundimonas sp. UBA7664]|uniref:class I SAM-dependent DNA methyltransferase n=1 Tax=Brevundimonas sp. UBA7664 TaxID=1946141 RepID=UPI0025BEB14D|nr:DNA methyltransferase [Brevundimonas sp. UBA7664]
MNPVEIEEAVSNLALEPFDRAEFPFQFLRAFDNPETTIKRLRSGSTNQSDIPNGVLQRSNIHIATCAIGEVDATLKALRESPKTTLAKAKFILATDGEAFQAEDLNGGGTVACTYGEFPDHFGFFLPLAGITTVREIRDSSFDIKATGRLNRLYIQLLKENPDWANADRQHDMNHFMARLIFCFFAEDTDIFLTEGLFTTTVEQMSAGDAANTHTVIGEIFRAMDTKPEDRNSADLPRYAVKFPYVNGQLFSGGTDAPRFSKVARSYLLHIGSLNWRKINPDIFGSMIQAVTDDDERGSLGMHYTSVPNILKVLNPLFLDNLRQQLEEAGANGRKLLNLRNRMARIRVFDPACGSGNFLVIAYKEMRGIEAEINKRRGEPDRRSDLPLTNFRGIELRDFPAEIARLALIIAEYQCDVLCRGQKEAVADFLPLGSENWITCGNALRLDWLSICPSTGTGVKVTSDDLFQTPLDQAEIDFENEGGETYLCGNPPYIGTKYQDKGQKMDLEAIFASEGLKFGNLDYVGGWIKKCCAYLATVPDARAALVTTTSLFQGEQAEIASAIFKRHAVVVEWCHDTFKWSNQAANNAGVACCIVGLAPVGAAHVRRVYFDTSVRVVDSISPYLVPGPDTVVVKSSAPISMISPMSYGSMSNDDNEFAISFGEYLRLTPQAKEANGLVKIAVGGNEFIKGLIRPMIYVESERLLSDAEREVLAPVAEKVKLYREKSPREATRKLASVPHLFAERRHTSIQKVFVPQILSERRPYITAGLLAPEELVIAPHMQIVGGGPLELALLSSKLHLVWISTVCGKLETRLRYSNSIGWNTFPVPKLTAQNVADLKRCGEEILLAREAHFPATIAELYDPEKMPDDLSRAHEANDEALERIYIGRRFRNDTERLEKLFELYTKMTTKKAAA